MFNIKSKVLGAVAVLPVVAVGLLGAAGSAEAAGLKGSFIYQGRDLTTYNPVTDELETTDVTIGNINSSFINFLDPELVSLPIKTGDFTAFKSAKIYDVDYNPLTPNPSLFMDLSANTFGTPVDGKNTFSLTKFEQNNPFITASNSFEGVYLTFAFDGIFDKDGLLATTGDQSQGKGSISFAALFDENGVTNEAQLLDKFYKRGSFINDTNGINASFQGMVVSTVPEPTTMLGLGLVAAGMTVARRRKSVKA